MKPAKQGRFSQHFKTALVALSLLSTPIHLSAGNNIIYQLGDDFAYTTSGEPVTLYVLVNDRASNTVADFLITDIANPKVLAVSEGDRYENNGTATITRSGIAFGPSSYIVYQPTTSFRGVVELTYTVLDRSTGIESNGIARVAVSPPTPTSVPPTAGDDWAVTSTGKTIYINPFWNDTGSKLTITSVEPLGGNKGSMTIDEAVNQLVYTADVKESGEDTFYYNIEDDSGRAASATIRVNVSAPDLSLPKASNDRAASPGGETIYINPLWNDTGSNLTIINVEGVDGNLGTMTIDTAVNQLVFKSNSPDIREETFTYTVEDEQGRKSSATVKVDVQG